MARGLRPVCLRKDPKDPKAPKAPKDFKDFNVFKDPKKQDPKKQGPQSHLNLRRMAKSSSDTHSEPPTMHQNTQGWLP